MKHSKSLTQLLCRKDNNNLQITSKLVSASVVPATYTSNRYVTYKIQMSTPYKMWFISKRYTNFEELHRMLMDKTRHLPDFPPKRFFQFSERTVNERKAAFETYLSYILKHVNIWRYPELLQFFRIEKAQLEIHIKNTKMVSSSFSTALFQMPFNSSTQPLQLSVRKSSRQASFDNRLRSNEEENYFSSYATYFQFHEQYHDKSVGLSVIEEFLRNLEEKEENKSEIVKTFTNYLKLKKNTLDFDTNEILILFLGKKDSKEKTKPLKGLFYHIGQIKNNQFGSNICIELLCLLLDYDFNPECDVYRNVFRTIPLSFLIELNLSEHLRLKENRFDCNSPCCKLLIILKEDNDSFIQKIITDEEIVKSFNDWNNNQQLEKML